MQTPDSHRPKVLSTVIPVFNEVESLETLYRELGEVAQAEGYNLEIIFVDDGSTDGGLGADSPARRTRIPG